MANRPVGYGYTAETTSKIDAKYDVESERQAVEWIEAVLGYKLPEVSGRDNLQKALCDGVILCKVMNVVSPDSVPNIHPTSSNSFKLMENVSNFLTAAERYGCARGDLFQSVYLTDNQNMAAVIAGIHALGRKAQVNGFKGPVLGPKEASANPREFSEEQLLHGRVHGI
ncbi:myophilin-like [Tubulanus polymorphus]|uniref:myophilin-like n=1 Tax=Tubulanus polymorphus TaxID=672921 RepID=UPI003DA4B480